MTTAVHRIAVAGASGRMGQMLIEAIASAPDCELVGALDLPGNPAIGSPARAADPSGVRITADLAEGLARAQFLIDFTRPEGTMIHLAAAQARGVGMVIGTTGFSEAQKADIAAAARHIPVMLSPNMSVGVNATYKLLELAARAMSSGYDIEIVEAHHRHKVDAPSGTALKMGEVIAAAQGRNFKDVAVLSREGVTGARPAGSIGFAAIRGGDVVGDHTVMFIGEGERIEISHKSGSRVSYAQGALRAVRYLATQPTAGAGLHDMFDVLGLKA
ncbi:MAG: hypothetical protein RLZZ126_1299 [Pseudomonadota bacterium]|jgi:4-hydroxy-tetrahydrodipicolinate reductase